VQSAQQPNDQNDRQRNPDKPKQLTKMFGAPYEDYRRRVKRWIPYVI
jgi:hypothetical protein